MWMRVRNCQGLDEAATPTFLHVHVSACNCGTVTSRMGGGVRVVSPEVVAPLADAVALVDHDPG